MACKLIIGATIDIAKLIAKLPYLWIFNVLDFVIVTTWKLTETNSQSFWEYGHY